MEIQKVQKDSNFSTNKRPCLVGLLFFFFVPLENFSLIWDVAITGEGLQFFYLYSSLTAMEQRGSLNMPTLYNDHLRGPVTLPPVAERLAVGLSLPVLKIWVSPD